MVQHGLTSCSSNTNSWCLPRSFKVSQLLKRALNAVHTASHIHSPIDTHTAALQVCAELRYYKESYRSLLGLLGGEIPALVGLFALDKLA